MVRYHNGRAGDSVARHPVPRKRVRLLGLVGIVETKTSSASRLLSIILALIIVR